MKHVLHRTTTPVSVIISAVVLLVIGFAFLIANQVHAVDNSGNLKGSLITIYDRDTKAVVLSEAETIGDALKEAGVEVSDQDVVEPAVDHEVIASEYQVNIYRARPVVVIDGQTRQRVMTPYQTGEQIAKSVGINLYAEDTTTLSRSTNIVADGAGLELTIDRATAFSFQLFGKKTTARTQATTVGDMLSEKGITLGKDDKVSPAVSTTLDKDTVVKVWREGKQTISIEEAIPFTTKTIQDANQPVGYSKVQTAGKDGSRDVTYQIEIRDGKEVKRSEIASLVTKQPVAEVKIVGTYMALAAGYSADRVAIMTQAGVAPADQGYAAYIIDNENALWCPIRWQGTTGCWASYAEKFPGAESSDQVGYGLCQATPGIKMATAGADWRTNPVTQMKWCAGYALGRYGSWQAAYNFKVANGWW